MYLCYVDESGCLGALPDAGSPIQPVFAIAGVVLDHGCLHAVTGELLELKRRFYPGRGGPDASLSPVFLRHRRLVEGHRLERREGTV